MNTPTEFQSFSISSPLGPDPVVLRRRGLVIGAIAVLLFHLLAYLAPLGLRPLARPDEFRYAEIPREMLATGDWISPRLLGMRYFEKPALGYQLTALSFALLGDSRFALRLPAALSTGLTAAMIFLLLALRTRSVILPPLAALLHLSFGLVFGMGVFAVLDAPFTAALTCSLMTVYLAFTATAPRARDAWLLATGAAAGAAFLIKGFLGFLLPPLVLVPFLLTVPRGLAFLRRLWIPLLAALLVAAPWSLAIHRREPDFWYYFIFVEHFARFFSQTVDSKPEPLWYFLPVLLGGVLPVGPFFLLTRRAWTREFLRLPLVRFALAGFLLPFLFFSVSNSKLGTYILPCFPFIAILLALSLDRAHHIDSVPFVRHVSRTARILGCGLVAVVPPAYVAWLIYSRAWSGPLAPLSLLLVVSLWGLLLLFLARRSILPLAGAFFLGLALTAAVISAGAPDVALTRKLPEAALRRCLATVAASPADTVYVDRTSMQPAAWTLRNADLVLVGSTGELTSPLSTYPEYAPRHVETLDDISSDRSPPGSRLFISIARPGHALRPRHSPVLALAEENGVSVIRF